MTTIKDVAKKANVSPSTVSRVIRDHDAISDKTKIKVRRVMDELGFTPNVSAQRLVTRQSHTIGLVLKSSSREMRQNPFFTDVLMSISKVCHENNYTTLITTSVTEKELLDEIKKLVKGNAVDGFVLLYSKENDSVLKYLQKAHIPFVIIGKKVDPMSLEIYIDNDNVQASYRLTDYIISLGHQHITFIAEDDTYAVNSDRIEGFKRACHQQNVKGTIISAVHSMDEIVSSIVSMDVPPTALITSDSMMNQKLLCSLYSAGIRIPDDIQTATFNDSYLNEFATPPQTVIDINPESLGREAGNSLLEYIKNPKIIKKSTIIPTSIIERQSTKPI